LIESGVILGIITALGALILAVSGLRSHRLSFGRTAWMAAAWVVIILGLFLAIQWFGA
jgi:hypothetical protein